MERSERRVADIHIALYWQRDNLCIPGDRPNSRIEVWDKLGNFVRRHINRQCAECDGRGAVRRPEGKTRGLVTFDFWPTPHRLSGRQGPSEPGEYTRRGPGKRQRLKDCGNRKFGQYHRRAWRSAVLPHVLVIMPATSPPAHNRLGLSGQCVRGGHDHGSAYSEVHSKSVNTTA